MRKMLHLKIAKRNWAADLSESSGLTLGLEEGEDVVLLDGALDVADDRSAGLVHELDADLDDTTARAGTAENLSNLLLMKQERKSRYV